MKHPLPFFATDTRQVWALDSATSQPYYLEEGGKEAAKERIGTLRCISLECEVPLIAIGGKRRHHFRHKAGTCPATTGESALHLAGKAMIKEWLSEHAPTGSIIKVEATVHPRRPDVLATLPDSRRVAYEVEYKTGWGVEEWAAKQADLDSADVPTLWLIGNTRFAPSDVEQLDDPGRPIRVKVPVLASSIAAEGRPLLAINPQTKQIGTLLSGDGLPYYGIAVEARLALDAIDECRFDPILGMVTPAMDRATEAERTAREKAAEEEAQRQAREARKRARRKPLFGELPGPQQPDGTGSLAPIPDAQHGDAQVDQEWRIAISADLIEGLGADQAFTVEEALTALRGHGISGFDKAAALARVAAWLDESAARGLLRRYAIERLDEIFYTPTEPPPGEFLRSYDDYLIGIRRRLESRGARPENGPNQIPSLRLGWKTRPVAFRNGVVRWVPREPWPIGRTEGLREIRATLV